MAINLASKYSDKIVEQYSVNSFINNANINNKYDFHGVKSLTVYTPVTVALGEYDRTAASNRFGTPTEMQDTIQTMEMTQDISFALTIDRGNNEDQMLVKEAGAMMNLQIKEQAVPAMDKYTFKQWITKAGLSDSVTPTADSIIDLIFAGSTKMDNNLVASENRILYITSTNYNLLRLSNEFLAVDNLAIKSLTKGMVGEVADMKVIKVPDSYLQGAHFLITQKQAVLRPVKIKTTRILREVAGIDGAVLEGRFYYDAFVLDAKKNGVYAAKSE